MGTNVTALDELKEHGERHAGVRAVEQSRAITAGRGIRQFILTRLLDYPVEHL